MENRAHPLWFPNDLQKLYLSLSSPSSPKYGGRGLVYWYKFFLLCFRDITRQSIDATMTLWLFMTCCYPDFHIVSFPNFHQRNLWVVCTVLIAFTVFCNSCLDNGNCQIYCLIENIRLCKT